MYVIKFKRVLTLAYGKINRPLEFEEETWHRRRYNRKSPVGVKNLVSRLLPPPPQKKEFGYVVVGAEG